MREKRGTAHILYVWLVLGLAAWQLTLLFPELELDKARELLLIILLGVLAEWLAAPFPTDSFQAAISWCCLSF